MSLLEQVKAIQDRLEAIAAPNATTPIEIASPTTPTPLTQALYEVKNQIDNSKQTQTQDKIQQYYDNFKANAPIVTEATFGTLVEYAVDFVEQAAPMLMKIMQVFVEDSSPFKLNTCITLIILVLPPAIHMTQDLIISLVNVVVKIKNSIEEQITSIENSIPALVNPKVGQGKKKSILSRIKGL